MTFERLIAEHDHIDALSDALEVLSAQETADIYGVAEAQFALRQALDAHFAYEDEAVYSQLMNVSGIPASAVANFEGRFRKLCADWNVYLAEWTPECLEADWPSFQAETRGLMARVRERTKEETNIIYALALRHGIIPLRQTQAD